MSISGSRCDIAHTLAIYRRFIIHNSTHTHSSYHPLEIVVYGEYGELYCNIKSFSSHTLRSAIFPNLEHFHDWLFTDVRNKLPFVMLRLYLLKHTETHAHTRTLIEWLICCDYNCRLHLSELTRNVFCCCCHLFSFDFDIVCEISVNIVTW